MQSKHILKKNETCRNRTPILPLHSPSLFSFPNWDVNIITLSPPSGLALTSDIRIFCIDSGFNIRLTLNSCRLKEKPKRKRRSKPMLEGRSLQQHRLYKDGRGRGTLFGNYHSASESWTFGLVGHSNDSPPFLIFGVSWTAWSTSALDACTSAFFSSFIIPAFFARFPRECMFQTMTLKMIIQSPPPSSEEIPDYASSMRLLRLDLPHNAYFQDT